MLRRYHKDTVQEEPVKDVEKTEEEAPKKRRSRKKDEE